ELLERDLVLLRTTRELAHPPRAGAGRARARGDGRLDEVDRPRVADVTHLRVGVAPLALQAATTRDRQLRQARTDLLDPLARGRDRDEVGLREVPVVLGVGLHAARRRDAGVLVPVPRLLDDGATGVEHGGLARDLVAHGPLDRAERVDVLRLGARAERRLGRGAQRQVHVGADVAALHPGLRDVERAEDVAQRLHVRARDLRRAVPRARDRPRDDLHERDARAVVVDERVLRAVDAPGGAADVGVLARVLLHV